MLMHYIRLLLWHRTRRQSRAVLGSRAQEVSPGGLCNRVYALYKTAVVGKFKAISSESSPPTLNILIDEFTLVCQRAFTHRITEVNKDAPNSLDQERLKHPASQSCPAISPPTSPCHPEPSFTIDGHFEGLLTGKQAHHGTGKEFTKGGRCTYIFCVASYCCLM